LKENNKNTEFVEMKGQNGVIESLRKKIENTTPPHDENEEKLTQSQKTSLEHLRGRQFLKDVTLLAP